MPLALPKAGLPQLINEHQAAAVAARDAKRLQRQQDTSPPEAASSSSFPSSSSQETQSALPEASSSSQATQSAVPIQPSPEPAQSEDVTTVTPSRKRRRDESADANDSNSEKTIYRCRYGCERSLTGEAGLRTHMEKVHNLWPLGAAPEKCTSCEKGFADKKARERHLEAGVGIKGGNCWTKGLPSGWAVTPPTTQQEMADTWALKRHGTPSPEVIVRPAMKKRSVTRSTSPRSESDAAPVQESSATTHERPAEMSADDSHGAPDRGCALSMPTHRQAASTTSPLFLAMAPMIVMAAAPPRGSAANPIDLS